MSIDPWHVFTANFGQMPKPYTAFVTLMDVALYFLFTANVIRARLKHKVAAPSVEGPDEFQRIYRVHVNMAEHLILHLPLLWLAAFAMDDVFAAAFGTMWMFGRTLYAIRYYTQAHRRLKGFVISMSANVILFLGVLASVLASL